MYFPACNVVHAQEAVLRDGIPRLIPEEFCGMHARIGQTVLSDEALWLCTTCYTCQERCPRGIPITDALLELRRLAVKEGFMLPEHRLISEMVLECGHAVPLDEETKKKREELGLDPIPETVQKYPEALQELKNLLKACKFDELVAER